MRSSVLARSRARVRARTLTVAAGAALASGLAGCATATNSTVSATGTTLTIYASAQLPAAAGQQAQDVLAAEQLAFTQRQGEVSKFKLRLVKLTGKLSDNARTAIENTSSIAYLGEIAPAASEDSAGITNAQDLLQVSPTDTALELTEPTAAVPGAPSRYYESLKTYGKTFARVVPNTAEEAKVQVQEMHALSVTRLYVADDGSSYGRAVALAVKNAASPAITVVSDLAGADGVFYGASSESAAVALFNHAAQTNPGAKLFGPSALDDQTFVSGLSPATRNVYISSPGFLLKDLSPIAKQKFLAPFEAEYHHVPALGAIFGYEAMAAVLDVLGEAGASANGRSTVVHDFFAIKNRPSVLGTYSINANGDTSLAPFVFNRLQAGKLVPFKFVQAQG